MKCAFKYTITQEIIAKMSRKAMSTMAARHASAANYTLTPAGRQRSAHAEIASIAFHDHFSVSKKEWIE
jgi:hypothetical protein